MKCLQHLVMLAALSLPSTLIAAGGPSVPLDSANIDPDNEISLQNGARLFVNYCMGCHSASLSRYSRVARDIGIPEDLLESNLIFAVDEDGEPVRNSAYMISGMPYDYAEEAFGIAPPDLSLIARSRGVDWLYTFMRSFYVDESRPLGFNNTLFAGVGMPHVLWELEGLKKPVANEAADAEDGHGGGAAFEIVREGQLNAQEYDDAVRDLVNFLAYVAEPYRGERVRFAIFAILFLAVFAFAARKLEKEYWKDVR